MSKVVDLHDLLEMVDELELPERDRLVGEAEALVSSIADVVANHLEILSGTAIWEQKAFAGLCVTLGPAFPGQDMPEIFDTLGIDEDGDWGPETCILTGAQGENPDDCTTHEHE